MGYLLVVDDNELVLRGLARALRARDRNVITASRVAEAKQLAEQEAPDVLITDLRLPGISGVHLIEWIHSRFPQTVIFVFSGINSARLAAQCGRLGALEYFTKGRDTAALIAAASGAFAPSPPQTEADVIAHALSTTDERKWHVLGVIEMCNGNVSESARVLRVPRSTLQRWLRDYDAEPRS